MSVRCYTHESIRIGLVFQQPEFGHCPFFRGGIEGFGERSQALPEQIGKIAQIAGHQRGPARAVSRYSAPRSP